MTEEIVRELTPRSKREKNPVFATFYRTMEMNEEQKTPKGQEIFTSLKTERRKAYNARKEHIAMLERQNSSRVIFFYTGEKDWWKMMGRSGLIFRNLVAPQITSRSFTPRQDKDFGDNKSSLGVHSFHAEQAMTYVHRIVKGEIAKEAHLDEKDGFIVILELKEKVPAVKLKKWLVEEESAMDMLNKTLAPSFIDTDVYNNMYKLHKELDSVYNNMTENRKFSDGRRLNEIIWRMTDTYMFMTEQILDFKTAHKMLKEDVIRLKAMIIYLNRTYSKLEIKKRALLGELLQKLDAAITKMEEKHASQGKSV